MSMVTRGTLALVENPRPGKPKIEHWQTGGDIGYTITGGDVREHTAYGDAWEHYRWTGRFRYQGRTIQIGFMRGMGLPGTPPAEDILASAFSDAESVRWDAFEGWANDMGYDPDDVTEWSRARRIYNACERMEARLARFIPRDETREAWDAALRGDVA